MSKLSKYLSKKTLAFGASMFLLGGVVLPTFGAGWIQDIQVRMGLSLDLDGRVVQPTDASGQAVPVFLYGSTTYVPVRFISENYGKDVSWDPNTATVHIKTPSGGQTTTPTTPPTPVEKTILDTFHPAAKANCVAFTTNGQMSSAGNMCLNGIQFFSGTAEAAYNLALPYTKIEFDVAFTDGVSNNHLTNADLAITGSNASGSKSLFNQKFNYTDCYIAEGQGKNHYSLDITGINTIDFKANTSGYDKLMVYNITLS